VVAEFDRLYIVAAPREDDEGEAAAAAPENDDDANVLAVEQEAKRRRVVGAENDWVKVGVVGWGGVGVSGWGLFLSADADGRAAEGACVARAGGRKSY